MGVAIGAAWGAGAYHPSQLWSHTENSVCDQSQLSSLQSALQRTVHLTVPREKQQRTGATPDDTTRGGLLRPL